MTQPSPPNNGIDIHAALSILSARAQVDDNSDAAADGPSVPEELRRMGQRIDVATPVGTNDAGDGVTHRPANPIRGDEKEWEGNESHEAMKRERARRGEELRSRIRSMGAAELLRTVFRAQEERVATYRTFEEGFSNILSSGNVTTYPALCAGVTASFSVQSDTVNAVKATLSESGREQVVNVISLLQRSEGEKLSLTAALHLERLRLRNSRLEASGGEGSAHARSVGLLENGIRSLNRKVATVVDSINDTLEELRCIAADEVE